MICVHIRLYFILFFLQPFHLHHLFLCMHVRTFLGKEGGRGGEEEREGRRERGREIERGKEGETKRRREGGWEGGRERKRRGEREREGERERARRHVCICARTIVCNDQLIAAGPYKRPSLMVSCTLPAYLL